MARHFIADENTYLDLPDDITPQEMTRIVNASFPKSKPIAGLGGMTAEQADALPSLSAKSRLKTSQGEGSLDPVPQWRQVAMQGANSLPEIGQAAGTAAGMAASTPFGGASSPVMIPAGAAFGRVVGKAVQTPLQQLLLPQAGIQAPTGTQVGQEAFTGATGGAMDAIGGAVAPRVANALGSVGTGPAAADAAGSNLTKIMFGDSVRDFVGDKPNSIMGRVIRPKAGIRSPQDAQGDISNVIKGRIDVAGQQGPMQIHNNISQGSQYVDTMIQDAADAGKTVKKVDILAPLQDLMGAYTRADQPIYARRLMRYVNDFNKMHPEDELNPIDAQSLKKFIYRTIEESSPADPKWGRNTYNPVTEARKDVAGSIARNVENATSDPEQLHSYNKAIGENIGIRDTVNRATNRIQNEPFTKRLQERGKQAVAYKLQDFADWAGEPDKVVQDTTHIGSPIRSLEEMFNVRFGHPQELQGPNRAYPIPEQPDVKQLPAPDRDFILKGGPYGPQKALPAPSRDFELSGTPYINYGEPNFTLVSDSRPIVGQIVQENRPQIGYEPNFIMDEQYPNFLTGSNEPKQIEAPKPALPPPSWPVTENGQVLTPEAITELVKAIRAQGNITPLERLFIK